MSFPKDEEQSVIDLNKVYTDEQGIYFEKKVTVFKWNDYLKKYQVESTRVEKVRPIDLPEKWQKSQKDTIYISKKVASTEALSDEAVVFSQEFEFYIPDEQQYKYLYIGKVQSGRIFFRDFNSGTGFEANINDLTFIRKKKAVRVPNDTMLAKNTRIYELDPSTGELSLRLDPNAVW